MWIKAAACSSACRRGGKQTQKRCPFGRPASPNLTFIPARHYCAEYQRQTGSKEGQRVHNSLLPEHVRNVMIGNCPVECLVKDTLVPKDNRHKTEARGKS